MKALFVTFEGGDGTGKSTQIARLEGWLSELGERVVVTREPGGTTLGQTLRQAVMHGEELGPKTEALLYAADRAHHVDTVIRPALESGAWVISDRYLDSSVAYQGTGRDLGPEEVENLSLWATGNLMPNLTVLLDLDPEVGIGRVTSRTGTLDRLERAPMDFHRRTREAFLERAASDPERWLVLDATMDVDALAAQVRDRVVKSTLGL